MTSNIFGDYQILVYAGCGGCGQVYVAKNNNEIINKKAYILKGLKGNYLTLINIIHLQKEIDNIVKLNENPRCEYIPILYAYDKNNFPIPIQEKKTEENNNNIINNEVINQNNFIENIKKSRPYYVMDYFSRGNLSDYIDTANGFQERHARLIFKKILKGIKFCHERGLCHLDIKPKNVVLNKEFTPIIIDFGLSEKFTDENGKIIPLKKGKGTKMFACPEMWEKKPYNGIKADIFSLGVFLFNLVTKKFPFKHNSKINDNLYSLIHQNTKESIQAYWDNIEALNNFKPSDNFKKLYLQMVAYDPENRPENIEVILKSEWMLELNDLTTLEQEVRNKFEEIYEIIQATNKEIRLANHIEASGFNTKAVSNKNNKKGKTAKKISNDRININHYITINGDLDEEEFMTSLIKDIKDEFDITQISINNLDEYENLKFELCFYDSEERDDDKFVNEEEEKEEEEDENNDDTKSAMDIELFQYEKGKYLLEFLRTKGEIHDYNKHFMEITKIIEEKTLKFNFL